MNPGPEPRRKSVWGEDGAESHVYRRDGSVAEPPKAAEVSADPEATEWAALHAGVANTTYVPDLEGGTVPPSFDEAAPNFDATEPGQSSVTPVNPPLSEVSSSGMLDAGPATSLAQPGGAHTGTAGAPDSTDLERAGDFVDWEDSDLWNFDSSDIETVPERAHPEARRVPDATQPQATYAADQDFSRYTHQDEYYSIVSDVLAIAMSGDPEVQGLIRSFVLTRDPELDSEQRAAYEEMLSRQLPLHGVNIPNPADAKAIIDTAYDELLGIGPLGPLWRDDTVTDILVNGPHHVTVESNGRLAKTPVRFRDLRHLQETARRLASKVDDRGISRTNPLVTVQLPGARVQIAWDPVAVSGASVVIRKHRRQLTLEELLNSGALTSEMAAFLADVVESRATVLVSGATGSGKTTYLNILSSFIPPSERVIVIEDARELHLSNDEVEYLLTKEAASADDTVLVGFAQLLRASLRMRPDRIIVGEILDSNGAVAMLEAAFTGHDGTMTTLHANNPQDALKRIAGLLRHGTGIPEDLAREQVNNTFDVVLQVVRDISGARYVRSIDVVGEGGSTHSVFTGSVVSGSTHFVRSEGIGADTRLAQRMRSVGIDTSVWE